MNLLKAGGTIGGLTMVSRILGFVREMIFARVMGATAAAEVFIWAFQLPNLLRRLLGQRIGVGLEPGIEHQRRFRPSSDSSEATGSASG